MKQFWQRFQHRNVAKVATAYAVVGWLMLQIIEIVLPTFNAPQWIAQVIIFVVIMGFPIALLIAWATEASNSLQGREAGDLPQSTKALEQPQKSRKYFYTVATISLSIVALFAFYVSTVLVRIDNVRLSNTAENLPGNYSQIVTNFRGYRSAINLGFTGVRGNHNTRTDIAVSPDGKNLAFLRHGGGDTELFIKDLTQPNAERSLGTLNNVGGSGLLFFSQTGEWLHFISGAKLVRVRIEGGSFQTISNEYAVLRSGYTEFNDQVIFTNANDNKLYKIPSSGGEAEKLKLSGDEQATKTFSWPSVLPNNKNLLVTSSSGSEQVGIGDILLYDIETGETKTIISTASNARYLSSGHIVFTRDAALWAVPFDLDALEITGSQIPVIQGMETNSQLGHAAYTVTEDGRLYYLSGGNTVETNQVGQIIWLDKNGQNAEVMLESQVYGHIALSPDETRVALTIFESSGTSDIWVWDIDRKTLGRRTFEGKASRPTWTADGNRLIYTYGAEGLRTVASNGTEPARTIFASNIITNISGVAPSGEIIFDTGSPKSTYLLDPNYDSNSEMVAEKIDLAPTVHIAHRSHVSPDGNWISYVSMETGLPQIYVRPFPNIYGGKWQISTEPSGQPIWSPSSNEIFYWTIDNRQFSVPFEITQQGNGEQVGVIEFGTPQLAFARQGQRDLARFPAWDYSETRERFLFIERQGGAGNTIEDALASQTSLVVVENWFEELASLAPSDN